MKFVGRQYLPYADSLRGSLSFLQEHPQLLSATSTNEIGNTLSKVRQLQAKMNEDEQIRQFIVQRKEQIKQFISQQKINAPDDYNMANSLAGMQTRDMVNQMIRNQVAAGGPGAAAAFSQGLGSAQGQLEQLKGKLSFLGSGSENTDLPPKA